MLWRMSLLPFPIVFRWKVYKHIVSATAAWEAKMRRFHLIFDYGNQKYTCERTNGLKTIQVQYEWHSAGAQGFYDGRIL